MNRKNKVWAKWNWVRLAAFGLTLATTSGCFLFESYELDEKPPKNDGGGEDSIVDAPDTSITIGTKDRICFEDSWCWYNPLPQGSRVKQIWASHSNDVWAIAGTSLLHWDGSGWSNVKLEIPKNLPSGIWGTGPTDVWVTGSTAIAHWDGAKWNYNKLSFNGKDYATFAIHGSDSKNIWVAGEQGKLFHWDGSKWDMSDTSKNENMISVWTLSSNVVWAIARSSNVLLQWNDSKWNTVDSAPRINKIAAFSTQDIWAMGGIATQHWNGSSWQQTSIDGLCDIQINNSSKETWILENQNKTVAKWDGSKFVAISSTIPGEVESFWVINQNDIWVGGSDGSFFHWDGMQWEKTTDNILDAFSFSQSIWANSSDNVWLSTQSGSVFYWNGKIWSKIRNGINSITSGQQNLWASSARDVWLLVDGRILRWDGLKWNSAYTVPTAENYKFTSIWGTSSSDVWVVGNITLHWDGQNWSSFKNPNPSFLYTISGINSRSIWAGGSRGTFAYWGGSDWMPLQGTGNFTNFRKIQVLSANDIWALIEDELDSTSYIAHWDGMNWKPMKELGTNINSLWVSGQDDIWFMGNSYFLIWSGMAIKHQTNQTTTTTFLPETNLLSLGGSSSTDIWAVGTRGNILRYYQSK